MMKQFWKYLININIYVYVTSFTPSQLPKEIDEFCPYSNICNKTAGRTLDSEDLIPCCYSCGCDEECGLRLDCCFEHLDQHKLVEKGNIACLGATISKGNDKLADWEINYYYMIQTCDNDKNNGGGDHELSDACRLTDDLGNSLIAPVSSMENNMVYINKQCAACNLKLTATPVKQWNYLFIPKASFYETTVTFDIEQHVENKIGIIQYIPPLEENWSHKRCFNRYSDISCKKSNVWYDLCEQFHAPFQTVSKVIYKNVFCVLCYKGENMNMDKACLPIEWKGEASTSFTTLLNTAVIEASKLTNLATVTNIATSENICPAGYIEHMHRMCLAIHCPGGMLKTADGCTYFALRWYTHLMVIYVKLLPKQGTRLQISQLQSFGNRERKNPFTWLRIPCRKLKLTSIEVYYSNASLDTDHSTSDNDTMKYVTSFIVRIWKNVDRKSGTDPALSIPMFHKCARDNWEANIGKETFQFDAHFDKYIWYVKDGRQTLEKWPNIHPPYEGIARQVQYTLLAEGPFSRNSDSLSVVVLKKLFFCKHVRVPSYDIEINFGEIRIISRNITVGTNEYQVNSPAKEKDWNKTTFSICIDDYDPNFMTNSNISKHERSSTMIFIILSILVQCMLT